MYAEKAKAVFKDGGTYRPLVCVYSYGRSHDVMHVCRFCSVVLCKHAAVELGSFKASSMRYGSVRMASKYFCVCDVLVIIKFRRNLVYGMNKIGRTNI